jgi:hypothetical protein
MKAKESLQKLTDIEAKINEILALEQVTLEDFNGLSEDEKALLRKIINEKYQTLNGDEFEKFFKKIEPITSQRSKNELWEHNQTQITCALSTLMTRYGRMPTKTELANETELSRQTIYKHFKEYSNHPQYLEQMERFKFLTSKVLTKVFHYAVQGDMGAAKLYLTAVGSLDNCKTNTTRIQNQNNYIQINGMVLSQEKIKHLTPDQLNTIETILKAALPESGL